ncbi:MAG: TIGR03621 family F420-dependent LLM class oxidoreductase [Actinomycetota bacterium]
MSRTFRFGHQLRAVPGVDVVERTRRAEEVGFDVVCVPDHVGGDLLAPIPTLAAVAAATERIRLGTYVLNASMRNPVQLAWEAVALDQLSGGRFELGLGAGHTPQEFDATGIARRPGVDRKADLAAQTEVTRQLLDGDTVTAQVGDLELIAASVGRPVQKHLPILVGGNGERLLAHAAAHADIIGLQGLGRTLEDGHRHTVDWSASHLDRQLEQVRAGADDRQEGGLDDVELNALVQVVDITDDAERSIADLCSNVDGLDPAELAEIPYVLIGTVDEIAAKLRRVRDRWGISYVTVRALDEFEPVIDALRSGEGNP